MKYFKSLVGAFLIGFCTFAQSAIMDFEDLFWGMEMQAPLPVDYMGFSWGDSAFFQTMMMQPDSGYQYGTLDYVSIFNSEALDLTFSSLALFTLDSAYLTSAWNIDETVTVEGLLNGTVIYSTDVRVNYTDPQFVTFNYAGIDSVRIKTDPEDGRPAGLLGAGSHVVIDNIQTSNFVSDPNPNPNPNPNPLPLPGTLFLMGAPLAFMLRRSSFRAR